MSELKKLEGPAWDALMELVVQCRVILNMGVIDRREYPRTHEGLLSDLEKVAPLIGGDEEHLVALLRKRFEEEDQAA